MKKSVSLVVAGVAVLALVWYVSSSKESSQSAQVAPAPATDAVAIDGGTASSQPAYTRTELTGQDQNELKAKYCKGAQSKIADVTGVQLYQVEVATHGSNVAISADIATSVAKSRAVADGPRRLAMEATKVLGASGVKGFVQIPKDLQGYQMEADRNENPDKTVCTTQPVATTTGNNFKANCDGKARGSIIICEQAE